MKITQTNRLEARGATLQKISPTTHKFTDSHIEEWQFYSKQHPTTRRTSMEVAAKLSVKC